MPQDVPLEASAKLPFTPESLKGLDNPPVFTLRVATWREKERRLDLQAMVGAIQHSNEALRDEIRAGLRAGWTEDQYDELIPWLELFWDAADAHEEALKENPDAVWEFDPEVEKRIETLTGTLERNWPPLAQMAADMRKYRRLEPVFYFAVIVEDWTGIDVKRQLDMGHLSFDCAYDLRAELLTLDAKSGKAPGTAMIELHIACMNRMFLREDFAKNSESPSQSGTNPEPSTAEQTTTSAGKSQASGRSPRTRRKA